MPVKIPHFSRSDNVRARAYESYCRGSRVGDAVINLWLRDIVDHLEELGPEYEGSYMTASGDSYVFGFWGDPYGDETIMIQLVIATGDGYYNLLLPKTVRKTKVRTARGDVNPYEM